MSHLKWKGLDVDPRRVKESIIVKPNIRPESRTSLAEHGNGPGNEPYRNHPSVDGIDFLMPRIESIHAGTTRNHTRYLADKLRGDRELRSGVYSWTHPYAKPVIYNHDIETRATGRIHNAYFSEITVAGRPGIIVTPKITDKKAIEDILGGLLLTVSIGATTDSAVCSVCGTDIIEEGFCGHYKGEEYEGVVAEWIAGNLWFDELSWVNVPADQDAMITDIGQIAIAEAFASRGDNIIDLGKKSTEWALSKEAVLAEGLAISNPKEKGDSALTIEELKAKVTELEEAKTNLSTKLEEATGQVEAKEAELVEANEKLEAKEAELTEKTTELEEKTQEVATLTEAKNELETAKAGLTEELEAVKADKETLVEKNTELSAGMHKSLVERVTDLRISLGKETAREEAIERYSSRSTESLNDTLADLTAEFKTTPVKRTVESVDNPGSNSLESNSEPKTVTEGKSSKTLSPEEALMGLFGGPAFRK